MISPNRIIDEIARSKQGLFRTFFPKFKSNSIKNFKNFKKFKTIILIGMGGSILGTKAIYSFLRNKVNKKIIFIDNLDQRYLVKIKKENNLKTALFLIISKSGNTTETIVNSSFFKAYLKKKIQ